LRAGIGFPRFQETTEKQVVQILVVESHEGEFDALEFALPDIRLGGTEAELADLLPIGVGWSALADAGNLYDPRPQIVLCLRGLRGCAETDGGTQGGGADRPLEDRASARSNSVMVVVLLLFHREPPCFAF